MAPERTHTWDVRLVVSARFITLFGTGMAPICLAAAALAEPGFGATGFGLAVGALGLGELAFVLVGGVIADRIGARLAMVVGDGMSFVAQALIALLFSLGLAQVWSVTVLALILGIATSLSSPASSSLIRGISTTENRVSVNASIRTAGVFARVIGAPAGGVVAATAGATVGLFADAATFLVSAALLMGVVQARRAHGRLRAPGGLQQIKEGWFTFRTFNWLLPASLVAAIVNAGRQVAVVMIPVILAADGYGPAVWGMLFGIQMLGNVVALWTVARIEHVRSLPISLLGVILVSLYYASIAGHVPLVLVAVLSFLAGGSISNFGMRVELIMQNSVPEDVMSRVAATSSSFSLALAPLAAGSVGYLSAGIGELPSLWLWAIAMAVAIVLGAGSRSIRQARTSAAPEELV